MTHSFPTRRSSDLVWVTYFPTHMIELYPHVVVLSTLHPVSSQETVNIVEFYYPEDIVAFEREFVLAQRAAYMETAIEDDEIAERMDAGRSEEHTSELQSLMRISHAVFCLQK